MLTRSLNICIILTAGCLAYISATLAGFLSIDDAGMISSITSTSFRYRDLFLGGLNQYYRPLVVLSFAANVTVTGTEPAGFHLVNIGIHLLNGLLVYYLAVLFFVDSPARDRFALIAALLFLLHPVNTEAVTWVSARPDLLCTFFFLLSLIVLVAHRDSASPRIAVALFLAFLASLWSKEAAISLAAVAPVYLLVHRREPQRGMSRLLLGCTVIVTCVVYLFLRSGGLQHGGVDKGIKSVVSNVATGVAAKPADHPSLLDAAGAYGFYLYKLVFPFPLNFTILDFNRVAALGALTVAGLCTVALLRRDRSFLLPLLVIFAGIVPPVMAYVGNLPWTPLGERYLYLPMIGFSLLVALIFMRLPRIPSIVVVALALLLAIPTMERVGVWCDAKVFWNDALAKAPSFAKNHSALGGLYLDEGNYDEAERHMLNAVSLGYGEPVIWQNLGRIYAARRDYDKYEAAMNRAAAKSPTPAVLYTAMVSTFMSARSDDRFYGYRKAIQYSLKAVEKDPGYFEAYYNIGKMYLLMGDPAQAYHYLSRYVDSSKKGQFRPFALKMMEKIRPGGRSGDPKVAHNGSGAGKTGGER